MPEPVVPNTVVNAPPPAAPTPAVQIQSAPVGSDITGVTAPAAGGTEPTSEQPAATEGEGAPLPEAIPYARFQEVVTAKNEQAERIRNLQAQVQVMEQFARQGAPGQPPAQPTAQPPSIIEEAMKQFGDDPYLNRDQVKTVLDRMNQSITGQIADLVFRIENPDFSQIISDQNGPLAKALQANPGLVQVIRSSPNPTMLAYQIGKTFAKNAAATPPVPPTPPPPPPPPGAPLVVPTLGALGGRGALGGKQNWSTMSDEEFNRQRAGRGIQPAI